MPAEAAADRNASHKEGENTDGSQGPVARFRGDHDFLSNFYPASVRLDGMEYRNAEAAFQAYKCISQEDRRPFTGMAANMAKRFGRRVAPRSDWEQVKLDVMRRVVRAKFEQHPDLAQRLLDTEDAELAEGNGWHDVDWGVDVRTGRGANHLGRILMDLRREFWQNGLPAADGSGD